MALREIITYPHPVLKQKARPVERVDDAIRRLVDDMFETMYDAPGIGLAAPQVGESLQLCVVDLGVQDDKPGSEPLVLINPQIVLADGKAAYQEGCLSLPDFEETIERAGHIQVRALGRDGKEFLFEADALQAVCIQHEMDHLVGITLAEKVSFLKRNAYLQKVRKGKIAPRKRGDDRRVVI